MFLVLRNDPDCVSYRSQLINVIKTRWKRAKYHIPFETIKSTFAVLYCSTDYFMQTNLSRFTIREHRNIVNLFNLSEKQKRDSFINCVNSVGRYTKSSGDRQ